LINIVLIVLSIPFCFYFANERANIIIGLLIMAVQYLLVFLYQTFADIQKTQPEPLQPELALISTEPIYGKALQEQDPIDDKKLTRLDDVQAEEYLRALQQFMTLSRPYMGDECSLQSVAHQTGIPYYYISHILNVKRKQKFADFVNEYRINEAKKLLCSPKSASATIESIAIECGFGSKSAFHRAFKKFNHNLTPTEFQRQNKPVC
ncbi:MAG TPA: helix-turn-helix domain-containing protein, partial [Paludibacter sp.]